MTKIGTLDILCRIDRDTRKTVMGRMLGWSLGCALVFAAVTFAGGIVLPELTPISQSEGAYMMGVIFFFTPAAFVVGAIAGIVIAGSTGRR